MRWGRRCPFAAGKTAAPRFAHRLPLAARRILRPLSHDRPTQVAAERQQIAVRFGGDAAMAINTSGSVWHWREVGSVGGYDFRVALHADTWLLHPRWQVHDFALLRISPIADCMNLEIDRQLSLGRVETGSNWNFKNRTDLAH
jgi:hypothetical protein